MWAKIESTGLRPPRPSQLLMMYTGQVHKYLIVQFYVYIFTSHFVVLLIINNEYVVKTRNMDILSLLNAQHCMYLISLCPTTPQKPSLELSLPKLRDDIEPRDSLLMGQNINSNLSLSFPRARRCFPPQHVTWALPCRGQVFTRRPSLLGVMSQALCWCWGYRDTESVWPWHQGSLHSCENRDKLIRNHPEQECSEGMKHTEHCGIHQYNLP